MNIAVLNTKFEQVYILDSYESLIWTDRYYGYGDFEIYLPFKASYLENLRQDYYLRIADSEHVMIIEGIKVQTHSETGDHLIITGRSLESLLERRIIWPAYTVVGNLQDIIKDLLTECLIDPKNSGSRAFGDKTYIKRKVDNFKFIKNEEDYIKGLKLVDPVDFIGDNLYEVILKWCQDYEIGFKITLEDINIDGTDYYNQFVFRLYEGTDRSFAQTENLWVIFSRDFDNIISTDYIDDTSTWRNFSVVAGEEGASPSYLMYGDIEKEGNVYITTGINHRELYVDARDLQNEELEGATYKEALAMRGAEGLNENSKTIEFTGEVEAKREFIYSRDFFMGDIIQITNEYGIEGKARVVEYIHNDTDAGTEAYPTFEAIQDYQYSYDES